MKFWSRQYAISERSFFGRRGSYEKKNYDTPHRECIVKTRLTEEERREFKGQCKTFSLSQSEYLRQAIFYGKVSTTIKVTAGSGETLAAVSGLVAQYGKIGGNLNQIAKHLNEHGTPYRELAAELKGCAADLAALKFEVLKAIGEARAECGWADGSSQGLPD